MQNPFKKPAEGQAYTFMLRGGPGTGKTYFALSAAKITGKKCAYIGTDLGAKFYGEHPEVGGFDAIETRDIKQIREAVTYLATPGNEYEGGIVVLDTTTVLWQLEQAEVEQTRVWDKFKKQWRDVPPFIPQNAWRPLKRQHSDLLRQIQSLPMHSFIICEEKPHYIKVRDKNGNEELIEEGTEEDSAKKDGHISDIRLRFFFDGTRRCAEVMKDRSWVKDVRGYEVFEKVYDPYPGLWIKGPATVAAITPAPELVMEPVSDDDPRMEAELRASTLIARIAKIKNEHELNNWIKKHLSEINQLETFTELHQSVIEAGRAKRSEFGEAA